VTVKRCQPQYDKTYFEAILHEVLDTKKGQKVTLSGVRKRLEVNGKKPQIISAAMPHFEHTRKSERIILFLKKRS
jgi:hypothetical protein